MKIRRALAAFLLAGFMGVGAAAPAMAEPPGPGDKQCVPGQQGNPHPGFKAGSCK
ncbi:hypothetical protein [Streptomyces regalis]|uniref:hypothetical protein n=1 Tax=Streptomyces regalis TaxID=68262 RepID=UPI000ABE19C3|nr:hypothetical protein [Streptomyces regalis]